MLCLFFVRRLECLNALFLFCAQARVRGQLTRKWRKKMIILRPALCKLLFRWRLRRGIERKRLAAQAICRFITDVVSPDDPDAARVRRLNAHAHSISSNRCICSMHQCASIFCASFFRLQVALNRYIKTYMVSVRKVQRIIRNFLSCR